MSETRPPPRPRPQSGLHLAGIPHDPPVLRPGRHRKASFVIVRVLAAVLALIAVIAVAALVGSTRASAATHNNPIAVPGQECATAHLGRVAQAGGQAYVCEQRPGQDCPRWHRRPPCRGHCQPPCRGHCQPCGPSCQPGPQPIVSSTPVPTASPAPGGGASPVPTPPSSPVATGTATAVPLPTPSLKPSAGASPLPPSSPPVYVPAADTGLPQTGAQTGWMLALGGLLVAAGVLLWLLGRRSRWVYA